MLVFKKKDCVGNIKCQLRNFFTLFFSKFWRCQVVYGDVGDIWLLRKQIRFEKLAAFVQSEVFIVKILQPLLLPPIYVRIRQMFAKIFLIFQRLIYGRVCNPIDNVTGLSIANLFFLRVVLPRLSAPISFSLPLFHRKGFYCNNSFIYSVNFSIELSLNFRQIV